MSRHKRVLKNRALTEFVSSEIAAKQFNDKTDAKGCKSFSRFLTKLAELAPRMVLKQISLLQSQLDSEAYLIRNAILEALGSIIKELVMANVANGEVEEPADEEQRESNVAAKQIDACFDLVLERFLDLNSHVRSKAVTTVTKLLE